MATYTSYPVIFTGSRQKNMSDHIQSNTRKKLRVKLGNKKIRSHCFWYLKILKNYIKHIKK